jgi:hypothetical protein
LYLFENAQWLFVCICWIYPQLLLPLTYSFLCFIVHSDQYPFVWNSLNYSCSFEVISCPLQQKYMYILIKWNEVFPSPGTSPPEPMVNLASQASSFRLPPFVLHSYLTVLLDISISRFILFGFNHHVSISTTVSWCYFRTVRYMFQ